MRFSRETTHARSGPRQLLGLIAFGVLVLAIVPAASAQEIRFGNKVRLEEKEFELDKAVDSCLSYCVEVTYEHHRFECSPVLAPPIERCDLPWIDPQNPTPDLWGQGELCVPEEAELAGFALREERELVTEIIKHRANCSSSTREHRQPLPRTGNAPDVCPGASGPWSWEAPAVKSYRFVPC